MARIRTIKPEAFTSESLASVSLTAERTFFGLLTQADDHGRLRDHPAIIAGQLWPLRPEHTPLDVEEDLTQLADADLICRYTAGDGKTYLHIVSWHRHQKINRPSGSRAPACPKHQPGTPPPSPAPAPSSHAPVPAPRTEGAVTPDGGRSEASARSHGGVGEGGVSAHGPDLGSRTVDHGSPLGGRASAPAPQTGRVGKLIGGYVAACASRPPKRVLDHLGREVKQLLGEGVSAEHVRVGLERFAAKPMHPSVLPSLVNEAMNPAGDTHGRQPRRAWTNPADPDAAYAEEL